MNRALLEQLISPEARLTWILPWLMQEIWTAEAFQSAGTPARYLEIGERRVRDLEVVLASGADQAYAELLIAPPADRTVNGFLERYPTGSVVILDGSSIREMPRLADLARQSRRRILDSGYARAALPSETEDFVRDRLGFGLPGIGPSALTGRKEFRDRGVTFAYQRNPSDTVALASNPRTIVWSRFPDQRYLDSHAASSEMYDEIWDRMDMVWKRTVQALPTDQPVLVTSDHGFLFLGVGLNDPALDHADDELQGRRNHVFEEREALPSPRRGLYVDRERRLGVLVGRCQNKPRATSPYHSLYRHGGLSLMEMLTPWLVLGPMGE